MSDVALTPIDPPRRFRFHWVPAVLFRPRQAFARISEQHTSVWLTPLVILSITALLYVAAAGFQKQAAALTGEVTLPPDYQYYSPEQQAQFQQAMAATQGPVFLFVFPAIMALGKVWLGWLLVGGLIHLVLTLMGGRGDTGAAMNLVAWASLPFALRDLVRAVAIQSTHRLISAPGLSGFAPAGADNLGLFLTAFLVLIDIYLIWHIILLVIGVLATNGLTPVKAIGSVLVAILLVLGLQALASSLMAGLGSLTIIRPFF